MVLCASLSTVAWAQQSEDTGSAPSGSVAVAIPRRVSTGATTGNVLYDNGSFADSIGTSVGGADESILENVTLGMSAFGWAHQSGGAFLIVDDFTVTDPTGWQVDAITFLAYQTGSTTTSPITDVVNLSIWDGVPGGGGSVVWGDTTTNVMSATSERTPTGSPRPAPEPPTIGASWPIPSR